MISRIATYIVGAASAVLFTATLAAAQTTPTPPAAGAAPPAVTATPGTENRANGQRRGERGQGRATMAACRADMQTLCGTVERGKGNKMRCLIENRTKASADCQTALTAVEAGRAGKAARKADRRGKGAKNRGGRMAACRADTKSLCADVQRGGGRKLACLKANEAKLTPACASTIKSLPNKG
jgi:hypothetical protein